MNTDLSNVSEEIADFQYLESVDQVHAISTKIRRRILQLLIEEPLTVTQLGKHLETPPPTVQYHVRELMAADLVRLAATRERRGILEKYYRAKARRFRLPLDPLKGQSPNEQLATINEVLEDVSRHVSAVLTNYNGEERGASVRLVVRQLYLRPEDLPVIAREIESIIERYADPHDSAIDREHIFVHLAVPTHPRRDDGTAEPDE